MLGSRSLEALARSRTLNTNWTKWKSARASCRYVAFLTQLARSLQFLHESKRIHTNLTPGAVVVNAKGDWKLAGVGYLTSLGSDESANVRWAFEDEEDSLPVLLQRDMDFMDPIYALDRKATTANDMYSLGVLIFTLFHEGQTPYQTHGSINALRSYADRLPDRIHSPKWNSLGADVQGMSFC